MTESEILFPSLSVSSSRLDLNPILDLTSHSRARGHWTLTKTLRIIQISNSRSFGPSIRRNDDDISGIESTKITEQEPQIFSLANVRVLAHKS